MRIMLVRIGVILSFIGKRAFDYRSAFCHTSGYDMCHDHEQKQVVVVGGGAAGLMAAGQAAAAGAKTILLEKMSAPGRKLGITGKGRCNLTNIAPLTEFIGHFGRNGRFLRQAFNRFFSSDLMEFLTAIGVEVKTERGGRVFPEGDNAPAVARALVAWTRQQGVTIVTGARVTELVTEDGAVTGVIDARGQSHSGTVVLTTGGASYPATGSTGDGYQLAASVGHTVHPAFPALVPLETAETYPARMNNLNLKNVRATLFVDGRKRTERFGELTFTSFGLSGPIILSLSREAVLALHEGSKLTLSIDLKPALDHGKLDARLLREFRKRDKIQIDDVMKTLLPALMIPVCLDLVGIPADKFTHQVTADERKRLRLWLKDFRLTVTGHRPFEEAIITAGGVDLREIDPRTMASTVAPGLFIAGELLDIDGDTGGYNLQAAFSTGWLAGRSAAESLR